MKRLMTFTAALLMAVSIGYGDAVTNTVKWNVPWGDKFRERAIETLDAFQTGINGALAGTSVELASNKVFIGSSLGKAVGKTLSGFFTITTGGVATATTTGLAVTNATAVNDSASMTSGTVAITKQTGAVTATAVVTPQAPGAVTPTITVTKETGAVTAEGANDLITPTITVTIQTTTGYDATGVAITNAAGETVAMMTNATATCSPDLASNAVVVVTVTGGGAVMTNATAVCSALPDFTTNATAAITVVGGDAVVTNATAILTPVTATPTITVTKQTSTFAKP